MRDKIVLVASVVASALGCRDKAPVERASGDPCAAPPSFQLARARADEIFIAEVLRVFDTLVANPQAREYGRLASERRATIRAERWWKRITTDSIFDIPAGREGDSTCLIQFEPGARYLVYSIWMHGVVVAHRISRTQKVQDAQADLQALGTPLNGAPLQ